MFTEEEILEASLKMEQFMELEELQESLCELEKTIEYHLNNLELIDFRLYLKMKAAQKAANFAIERIITIRGQNAEQVSERLKQNSMQKLSFRKRIGKPSAERSRAKLRLVRGRLS